MQISFSALGELIPMSYIRNFFYSIFYNLFVGVAKILDYVQLFFRKLAGIETYLYEGQLVEGDIVLSLIKTDVVKNVFWSLVILAILLLFVCTIITVVKTEWNWEKEGNSKKKIIKNVVKAIFNMVLVPIFCIFGITLGNALLSALDGATAPQNATTFSRTIWITAAYNSNKVRDTSSEFYRYYFAEGMNEEGYNKFGIFTESAGTIGVKKSVADKIDDAFLNNLKIPETTLSNNGFDYEYSGEALGDGEMEIKSSTTTFNIMDYRIVRLYYDMLSFDFIIAIGGAIFLCWIMVTVILGLIKRMFTILVYFCIVPPVIAISPLDEGAAFKKWRQTFIGSVISAYSAVVVMNLYLVFVIALGGISFFYVNVAVLELIYSMPVLNYFARLLIIIGGGLFVKDAIGSISSMIGGDDLFKAGDGKWKDVANVAGKGFGAGLAVAGGGVKAVKYIGKFAGNTKQFGLAGAFDIAREEGQEKREAARNNEKTLRGKIHKAFGDPKKTMTSVAGGKTYKDLKEGFFSGMGQPDKQDKNYGGPAGEGTPKAPNIKLSSKERMQTIKATDAFKNANFIEKNQMLKNARSAKEDAHDNQLYDSALSNIQNAQDIMNKLLPSKPSDDAYNEAQDYINRAMKNGSVDKRFTKYDEMQKIVDAYNNPTTYATLSVADKTRYDAAKATRDASQKKLTHLQRTTTTGANKLINEVQQKAKDDAAEKAIMDKLKQEDFEKSVRKKNKP